MSVDSEKSLGIPPATGSPHIKSTSFLFARSFPNIPRLFWGLLVSYMHVLRGMLRILSPRVWKLQVIAKIRSNRRCYDTAFPESDKPKLTVFLRAIHFTRIDVLSKARIDAIIMLSMFLLFVPPFTYLLTNSGSLADHFGISDSLLVSKVSGSSLFGLFVIFSTVIVFFWNGTERKALLFCSIIFSIFFSASAYSEYNDILKHDSSTSIPKFANAIILGALVIAMSFMLYLITLHISFQLLSRLRDKYIARRYPDAAVFTIILKLLAECNADVRKWTDLAFKRRAIALLESSANIIAKNMPKKLIRDTSASSSIVKGQFHRIAGGLRNKIFWITTPQDNTRQEFIIRLQQFLIDVALGRWDALEKQDVTFDHKSSWLNGILSISRWCLLAFAPIGLLYAYEYIAEPLSAPLNDYARLGALGWLALSVISVDPLWREKLSAIKDFISMKRVGTG